MLKLHFQICWSTNGMATVTDTVLLLTVSESIRHSFVTYCWLPELPNLSLMAAKRTLGKLPQHFCGHDGK